MIEQANTNNETNQSTAGASNRSCGNCRWSQFILGQPQRECRRYPPNIFPIQGARGLGFVNQFPLVDPKLSCGEFAPKLAS